MAKESTPPPHVYIFPASSAQRSLWFLDQLAPGSPFYNLAVATRLRFALNVPALRRSINEIVQRHEALRTAFGTVDGEPVQLVAPSLTLEVPLNDLRSLPARDREAEALRITSQEAARPFDLATWPLVRARLVRIDDDDHILIIVMHHVISDFWSRNILQEELSTVYDAFCQGSASPLADLPLQYADYAAWEAEWLRGPSASACLAFWRKQLAELPTLELPTDWPRPAVATFRGGSDQFWIDEDLYTGLLELSREENATLFMTLVAGFQALLYRYSGQVDIVTGTPVANREDPDVQNVVGLFTNSLVLRTDFSGEPSFREVLRRVRDVALDGYSHQDYPFEKLVSELKPERAFARNPLFQVHFQLLGNLRSDSNPPSLVGEPVDFEVVTTKFDLALDMWEDQDGLSGYLEYSSELFTEATIVQLVRHFTTLLEAVVADPDRPVVHVALLDDEERQHILVDWNATGVDNPRGLCLHELFEGQVERSPNAVAVVFQDEQVTYAELNERANRLARHLRTLGVGPESLVVIAAHRSIEMIVGLLGILKAGGAYVPLDPRDPSERLARMIADAQPCVIVTHQPAASGLPLTATPRVYLDADWPTIGRAEASNLNRESNSRNLAYAIYTSGSTGTPKAVLIESRSVCNHLLWMQSALPLVESDRVLLKYPYNFDASICEIFGTLLAGAQLIITEPAEHWDATEFIRVLHEHHISVLDLVPSMLETLLGEVDFAGCRTLRRVVCGGELISPQLRDRFFLQMNAELHNIYGPTEATIGATWTRLDRQRVEQPVTIGRPIANTEIYILDAHRVPVPIGVAGELCIAGECLARGYLNQPALTAEKFVPNPFSDDPDARMYLSGDRARYRHDGTIEYLGRIDDQVKVRGHRVEPAEVERALSSHPKVRACAVVPLKDSQARQSLVAYVVPPPEPPQLWPSLGEYDVYDAVLYHAMTRDERRTRAYETAIRQTVRGKTVLDIGTGADAILARLCVEAGAKHVYAVEVDDDAFERAAQVIAELGFSSSVTVIHADSIRLELPDKVDVCVSEILGTIGSSEGAVHTLNDARRFLNDGGRMIPRRCITRFAPVCLPDALAEAPHFMDLPAAYVEQVFERVGYPFDLRLCVKNFPPANLLAPAADFEDLDFSGPIEVERSYSVGFEVQQDSRMDGLLLWLNLYPGEDEVLDSLHNRLSWLPVFLPLFHPGLPVARGDRVNAIVSCNLSSDRRKPDYSVVGNVVRAYGAPVPFHHLSAYCSPTFGGTAFHRAVFANAHLSGRSGRAHTSVQRGKAQETPEVALVPELRRFLRGYIPEYGMPTDFVIVDELPVTSTGKLDRKALRPPRRELGTGAASFVPPGSKLEQAIASVWAEVLEIGQVGVNDNFFDLGGDSLLITQVRARLNWLLNQQISVVDLFRFPTVSALAQFAEGANSHAMVRLQGEAV